VPYLGLAQKYDRRGFEGFPERCGIDVKDIVNVLATFPTQALAKERNTLLIWSG
jgi:hypothetical protein